MDDFSSKICLNEKMSIKVLNTVPGNKLSGLLYTEFTHLRDEL